MSLSGLRFTLKVDGQESSVFAVVSFWLMQNNSSPFVLEVDVASKSFNQEAKNLLEKKGHADYLAGPQSASLHQWSGIRFRNEREQ